MAGACFFKPAKGSIRLHGVANPLCFINWCKGSATPDRVLSCIYQCCPQKYSNIALCYIYPLKAEHYAFT